MTNSLKTDQGSVTVRRIEPDDFTQWLSLWSGYNAFYGRSGDTALPEAITRQTWAWFVDQAEPVHAWVAELQGELVGFVHVVEHKSTSRISDVCYLQDLFTAPTHRGKGIARALIGRVYQKAKEMGCSRVYWTTQASNEKARYLYDQVATNGGFIVYSQEMHSPA